MQLTTRAWKYTRAFAANAVDVAYPSRVPTITRPTGGGVITLPSISDSIDRWINLAVIGVGADNATLSARLIGWKAIGSLFIPVTLLEIAATLSAVVGVAASDVLNTERFADTLAVTVGVNNETYVVTSPANDTVAHILAQTQGFDLLEFVVANGTATAANCLWSVL